MLVSLSPVTASWCLHVCAAPSHLANVIFTHTCKCLHFCIVCVEGGGCTTCVYMCCYTWLELYHHTLTLPSLQSPHYPHCNLSLSHYPHTTLTAIPSLQSPHTSTTDTILTVTFTNVFAGVGTSSASLGTKD